MRFFSATFLSALSLSLVAVPTADAWFGSALTGSVTKYDLRAATKAKKAATTKKRQSIELPAVAKGGLLFGDPEAAATIVMFTDIECPFCKRFHKDTYPSLKKEYLDSGNVRFVIRHFPLSFHAHANDAAEAVVCARAQGDDKARSLYEKLMSSSKLSLADIMTAAGSVDGLDTESVIDCIDTTASQTVVEGDMAIGKAAKVTGTPFFLLYGPAGATKTIMGAYPFETFEKALKDVQKK